MNKKSFFGYAFPAEWLPCVDGKKSYNLGNNCLLKIFFLLYSTYI
jgi:hypothetical protein